MTSNYYHSRNNYDEGRYSDGYDDPYERPSLFARIGSRFSRTRYDDFQDYQGYAGSGGYDSFNRYGGDFRRRSQLNGYGQPSGYGQPNGYGGYYQQERYAQQASYRPGAYTGRPEMRQMAEPVEQIVYNSATLSGVYHNLDNPKGDIRSFEQEQPEEGGDSNET